MCCPIFISILLVPPEEKGFLICALVILRVHSRRFSLGDSDHNVIHLVPLYKQRLKTSKLELRTIQICNDESVDCLRGCFDCTAWDVFIDTSEDLDELNQVVTDYIHFCVGKVIPKKCVYNDRTGEEEINSE